MAVYLFYGEDRFARLEAVAALRREHDADGALVNNSVSFDGARLSLAELGAAVAAAPFLGGVRWVRVDGLCARFGVLRRGGRQLGEWDGLPEVLEQIPATTILVFVEDEVRRGNPMLQLIEPLADTREFARLKPEEALEWLRGEVRRRGLHLTRNAAQTLVERAGGDRGSLTQAVDKLSLYAGDANVDETIVEAMVPATRSVSIFNLVDAVAERRLADAMRALDGVRAEGEPEARIIQMLARTFRQIVVTREVIDRGGSNDEIQQAAGANFAWLARRLRRQAQSYTQTSADAALTRILEAEEAIISYRRDEGGLTEDVAVELLVADLAGARR
ncbi:MAG: DNA polymerase III subunit delta [Chloroflexi bacterium]|nr:DNA polymerase III subunit delta [Chloroflexota bacterium]MCY3589456.1 DNA polymerase III subunit delta [Chloroflexota bacterium]MCY3685016.1 DNA polymerase III subunit delta [Chloroflexota bacterium]MDE2707670.1 DNA polymerase III subunit delta [Chloroflexota bacterium]